MTVQSTHAGAVAALLALTLCTARTASASPVLRSADLQIAVLSPTACEVTMTLAVDGRFDVDHRIEAFDGTRIDLTFVRGAGQANGLRHIGRTQSLVLRPAAASYHFQYRALQPDERAYRCPIWLPAVPTDGRSRPVTLRVRLPPSTSPAGSSMPAFTWNGAQGTARLGHIPAFIRVPYASGTDQPAVWQDVARVMDGIAVTVFVAATALWAWRRRRGPQRARVRAGNAGR